MFTVELRKKFLTCGSQDGSGIWKVYCAKHVLIKKRRILIIKKNIALSVALNLASSDIIQKKSGNSMGSYARSVGILTRQGLANAIFEKIQV